ncbi:hypothetical protein BD769DRAFT_1558114 [Suillus cothurnatus]|nr:hypothetical protein BD769DRAFT_1558114 [Suillus cothurnatus]
MALRFLLLVLTSDFCCMSTCPCRSQVEGIVVKSPLALLDSEERSIEGAPRTVVGNKSRKMQEFDSVCKRRIGI